MTRLSLRAGLVVALSVVLASTARAATPAADTLLPATTKGYLSIPDLARLESDADGTQLGRLFNDPDMQPFVEDLKAQLRAKGALQKVGVTLDDLRGIVTGEVAFAVVQHAQEPGALVIADVTGNEQAAQGLLKRMRANLAKQGGKPLRSNVEGLSVFELPPPQGQKVGQRTASFLQDSLLCVGNSVRVVQEIQAATRSAQKQPLSTLPAYVQSLARVGQARAENEKAPHARWFVEPFGYAEAMRVIDPPTEKRKGPDRLKVLRDQGFSAIQGLGGEVTFAAGGYELLHRTMIYAPGKLQLAARMLDFPNGLEPQPPFWVPDDVSTYNTWSWNIERAFAASETLVDEWTDEPGMFREILDSLRDAKDGPRVDIEKELVANLGQRVTMITDYQAPITIKSERWLAGVATTDEKAVSIAVEKSMKDDPSVRRREVDGWNVWEITNEERVDIEELVVELPGTKVDTTDAAAEEELVVFQPGKARQKRAKAKAKAKSREQQRRIQNAVVTVAYGQLFVASHIDLLERVLKQARANQPNGEGNQAARQPQLAEASDFNRVMQEVGAFNIPAFSFLFFSRTDQAFRVNYELMRKNQMPQSESILGRLLNRALGDNKPGAVRKPRLDFARLPPYSKVEPYLGPAGAFIVTQRDGWFCTGFTLKREGSATAATPPATAERRAADTTDAPRKRQ